MSITDSSFFDDNIVNNNKKVELVLYLTALVPVSFIIITLAGIWIVPHAYSFNIIVYSLISATICHFFNCQFLNKRIQILSMYIGIIASSGFVFLLAVKGIIIITVSYACVPFLSCIYYNRRLTIVTTIANFILAVISYWIRSPSVKLVEEGIFTANEWFLQYVIGLVIEFIFIFLIADFIARRTSRTLHTMVSYMEERDEAYKKLNTKNQEIVKLNRELTEKNKELDDTQYKIIKFVAQCLGSHDLFTGRHVLHTQKYVEIICKELKASGVYADELDDRTIELYTTSAFLHDIGKIHIPEGILNKTGKFTPEEFEMMKSHPVEGRKLLEYLPVIDDGKFNEIAKEMALYHHEKWDGSGYPFKLAGYDIPLCARIMTAADVLDALLSQRLYKEAMSIDEAMDIFNRARGLHFEPCIADAVIRCKDEIEIIDEDFKFFESSTNAEELEWWQKYHANLKI